MRTNPISNNKTTALNAVAFTGHRTIRPEHLSSIKSFLSSLITRCYDLGFCAFYSGMAVGFDLLAAEVVLELKESRPSMKLFVVVPFPGQEKYYSEEDKARYSRIIQAADGIIQTSQYYHSGAYKVRNQFLVTHANIILAYFDGTQGKTGTAQTIRMAQRDNKRITNVFTML